MAYAVVTVIVDGALESETTFHDETAMHDFIRTECDEARGHGYRTDIDVRFHDHADDIECECAQYESDHHPAYVVNGEQGEQGRWGEAPTQEG